MRSVCNELLIYLFGKYSIFFNIVFIRILGHAFIGECPTIRTCSDYFETEGGFLF